MKFGVSRWCLRLFSIFAKILLTLCCINSSATVSTFPTDNSPLDYLNINSKTFSSVLTIRQREVFSLISPSPVKSFEM